jgi:hypothetical protein
MATEDTNDVAAVKPVNHKNRRTGVPNSRKKSVKQNAEPWRTARKTLSAWSRLRNPNGDDNGGNWD